VPAQDGHSLELVACGKTGDRDEIVDELLSLPGLLPLVTVVVAA
jgi:hypothetical protein